ncbi:MAG TPA: hypothetical protein VMI75_14790 [Polyangiaceae bacterium]|nr:hypothetical protein [Polyangiaceae bacterium]
MRTSWIVILGCVAVALAGTGCGGKSFGSDLGDAGDDGGSSGGSSGGSGSGSGSSSSGSGGSSSGSGGSSSSGGGSGSSSGGGLCPASPGEGSCSYGEQCNYGSGCGETFCTCSTSNQWECAVSDCPPPVCPQQWPQDLPCGDPGMTCDYPTGGGSCGSSCTCVPYGSDGGSYAWNCVSPPCPPPSCPPYPPQPGDACTSFNESCDYAFDAGCGGEYCTCDASGTWFCAIGDCVDAGPPIDAGTWHD